MNLTPGARPIFREVGLVFAVSLIGCLAIIGIGKLVPFVGRNLHAFVAALFILLPAFVVGRRGEALEDYGLNAKGLGRALAIAGLVCVVTFPPYVAGHHAWQTWLFGRTLRFDWNNYAAFPDECEGPPRRDAPLSVWCERGEVRLQWRGAAIVEARGEGIAVAGAAGAKVTAATPPGAPTLLRFEGTDGWASLRVPPGREAAITARRDGGPLSPAEIEVGSGRRAEKQPVRLGRGWWWLLELLFAQVIAVGLPEEIFYRGYIQGRLTAAFARRRRILGADVRVAAIFWTSVLFALGHFLLDLNPARLAVFFPSLLFGWIRAHTETLGGAIVYHALCNVLVRLLLVHY